MTTYRRTIDTGWLASTSFGPVIDGNMAAGGPPSYLESVRCGDSTVAGDAKNIYMYRCTTEAVSFPLGGATYVGANPPPPPQTERKAREEEIEEKKKNSHF